MLITLVLQSAQETAEKAPPNFLTPNGGLMIWTVGIFLIVLLVLSRYAFKPITAAVQAREKALEDAIEGAKRDREEAAKLLDEQRRHLEASRDEGQKIVAAARAAAEEVRSDMLDAARAQQQEILERAKQEISRERDDAIADLRREAVDLAILGASKVIEKNLDDKSNRDLIEKFLTSLDTNSITR
jgi:F-type H+-transporting ATPase subunit b